MSDDSVWLLSRGSYSDYEVVYVCADEAIARAFYERFREDGEWNEPTHVPMLTEVPERVYQATAWLLRSASEHDPRVRGDVRCNPLVVADREPYLRVTARPPYGDGKYDWLCDFQAHDTDRERAIRRVAAEQTLAASNFDQYLLLRGFVASVEEITQNSDTVVLRVWEKQR